MRCIALFFDSYRIVIEGASTLLSIYDVLKNYEENAAVLIDKQRDHYIHSVNVFLLGLCIFAQNSAYREAFTKAALIKVIIPFLMIRKMRNFFIAGVLLLFFTM